MSPHDTRHGSEAGHQQHVRDGEDACDACYDAKLRAARRRSKRKTMGHRYTVPSGPIRDRVMVWRDAGISLGCIADHTGLDDVQVWELVHNVRTSVYTRTAVAVMSAGPWPVTPLGITRRVQALTRLGYAIAPIADAAGVHHDTVMDLRRAPREFLARTTRDRIVAAYDALAMRVPTATSDRDRAGVTRVRNYAAARGWSGPLAWDDIDDPNEIPAPDKPVHGGPGRPEVMTARIEDFDWLIAAGESEDHAAARVGITHLDSFRDQRRAHERQAS